MLEWDFVETAVISVRLPGGEVVEASDSDLFDCLIRIRKQLERINLLLCCNGARRDCYPSRMSRDMGGAQRILKLEMGKVPSGRSMVDTFGEADPSHISTPEEQEGYYRAWLKSLS